MESLEIQTINYITDYVKNYYYKALEHGAELSDVKVIGIHLYSITLGKALLTFMGTAEGTAIPVGFEGDIF